MLYPKGGEDFSYDNPNLQLEPNDNLDKSLPEQIQVETSNANISEKYSSSKPHYCHLINSPSDDGFKYENGSPSFTLPATPSNSGSSIDLTKEKKELPDNPTTPDQVKNYPFISPFDKGINENSSEKCTTKTLYCQQDISLPDDACWQEHSRKPSRNSYTLSAAPSSSRLSKALSKFNKENNELPDNPSLLDRMKSCMSCPPHGHFGNILTWVIFSFLFWGVLIAITGSQALPGGNLFSLLVLIILAQLGGKLVERFQLPPLLGMIIVGILLRSVPVVDMIGSNIDKQWSATIRKMALVVILTRAGLGLDPQALRKLSFTVIRLGVIPNLVEMGVVAVVSHFLLSFPWVWSFMLGFIFSGVSPSVVVPCMLTLSDRRLGVDKGVPTLIIAGLSIDNALSISGIGVFTGIIFSEGSIVWQAFKGPVEVIIGIIWGIVVGTICWSIPNRFEKGYAKFRCYFLFAAGLLSVFGSQKLDFGGAGAIGCLTIAFVAGIGWRNQGWLDNKHPVKQNFNFLWCFYQPLLFGLIGTEIQISALNGNTVSWGVITLLIGLSFRIMACFLVVQGSALNLKEKFFAAISWLPKATIQAAFGSLALDFARSRNTGSEDTPEIILGQQVLTLAVLAIVIAAPIGAVLIMLSAPKLLHHSPLEEKQNGDIESK